MKFKITMVMDVEPEPNVPFDEERFEKFIPHFIKKINGYYAEYGFHVGVFTEAIEVKEENHVSNNTSSSAS